MEFVQTLLLGFAALCAGCVLAALRHSKRPLSRAELCHGVCGCGAGGAGGGDAAAFARRAGAVSRKNAGPAHAAFRPVCGLPQKGLVPEKDICYNFCEK